MAETSKARERRLDSDFYTKLIYGKKVIDIGCGALDTHDGIDPVYPTKEVLIAHGTEVDPDNNCPFFIENETVVYYHDKNVCDAHTMEVFKDEEFDTVYASHVLEHMDSPIKAIISWFRLVKPGGFLFISVPHRDLYERKETLPSKWNADHKFFILPFMSYPPHTFSLDNILNTAFAEVPENNYQFLSMLVQDSSTNKGNPEEHANGEFSIEVVIRKK
jgi:SAM-dependent methyltransferase